MAFSSRLELIVDTRTGAQRLREFESQLDRTQGSGDRLAKGMGVLKIALGAAATAAGGFTAAGIVRETAAFEQSLLRLQVVSGATTTQMAELEAQSRSLGATSMFSAQQAADAQNYLAMAGFRVNEVLSATPGILQLAAAGNMDLAKAADLASNVLGGMRLEVEELTRVNDVLARTANGGANTSIIELGDALSYAAPLAATAGISLEETSAALGALADAGLKSTRSGTGLLGFIRQLSNVTPNAESALEKYGLTTADVNIEQEGLLAVLERLREANINTADSFKIFGSEVGPAAQILASSSEKIGNLTEALHDVEGAAAEAALILGSGLEGSFRSLNSAIGESTLQLGRDSGLSGGLQDVINYATGVISVYNGMLPLFQEANDLTDDQAQNLNSTATALALTAGAVGGLTSAYVLLTAATWAAQTAQVAFMRVMRANPIVLVAGAVTALSGALYTARNRTVEFGDTQATIMDWLEGAWSVSAEIFSQTWDQAVVSVVGMFESISAPVSGVATYLWDTFRSLMVNLGNITKNTTNAIIAYFNTIGDVMGIVANAIWNQYANAFDKTLNLAQGFWQDLEAIFSGDFSFTNFKTALQTEIVDPLAGAASEIAAAFDKNLSTDYVGDAFGVISDGAQFLADDFEALGARISDAAFISRMSRGEFGLVAEGFEDGAGSARTLQDELDDLRDQLTNTTSETEKLTKAQKDAIREAEEFERTLQSLQDRLYPVEAAQRTYREEQELLTLAWAKGEIGVMRYLDALNRLQEAQLSTQTASAAYGGGGGFGSEIGSRGEVGAPTDPLASSGEDDYWTKWLESAETALTDFDQLAANTAESFQRGFGNAFESMMFDSENAGDAARNMLLGMSRTAVNAIGQMIGQWVAYQAVQLATGKTAEAAAIGSAAVAGPAIAAAYAPAAAAVSLASFGANSAPAMVGMSSAYGLSSTLSMAGFAEGGWTGPGAKYDIAGIVHADEYVMPKDVVSRPGMLPFLESLRNSKGYASGGYVGPAPSFADRMPAYSESKSQQAPQMRVTINNHTDAKVRTTQDKDGGLTIEMVKSELMQDMADDGSFSKMGSNVFGWNRVAR